jgi:hypothetical protein
MSYKNSFDPQVAILNSQLNAEKKKYASNEERLKGDITKLIKAIDAMNH